MKKLRDFMTRSFWLLVLICLVMAPMPVYALESTAELPADWEEDAFIYSTVNQIPIGYKNIRVADIYLRESVAGAFRKSYQGKKATLDLLVEDGRYIRFSGVESCEVIEGDLQIENVKVINKNGVNKIQIAIKSESSTPSVLHLKGVEVTTDRATPTGYYDLYIGGTSIIQNVSEDKKIGWFDPAVPYFVVEDLFYADIMLRGIGK